MGHILVVDDDVTVREVVVTYLRAAAHEVTEVADGAGALAAAEGRTFDLVLLDVMMPGMDGLEVARRMRASSDVPIVLLTALGDEQDRVIGLELGADDYVTKPFSPRELTLRVASILRRTGGPAPETPTVLTDGDLQVDCARHEATLAGETLSLTAREFDLLAHLMAHPGQALSRDELHAAGVGLELR